MATKVTSLKDFKKLKEENIQHVDPVYVKDIIIGSHPIALKILKKLSQTDAKEDVLLIHEFAFNATFTFEAPRLFRGNESYEWFKSHFSEMALEGAALAPKFYKDGEKREFGARVKPHEIKEEEKFFCQNSFYFSDAQFYGDFADYAHLENKHIKAFIKKITPLKLEELASRVHYEVVLTDGKRFHCENLYSTVSPLKMVELLDKEKLDLFPAALYSYAKNLKPLPSLFVRMKLKGEWEKDLATLFVPQSQTHEWGSFIVEFEPYDSVQNTQSVGVFCYLTDNEMADNEEVAKKIRLMKRVLDRVYEGMEKQLLSENITLSADFIHSNCEDSILFSDKNAGSIENIKLVHIAGPITTEAASGSFSSLIRLLSNYYA